MHNCPGDSDAQGTFVSTHMCPGRTIILGDILANDTGTLGRKTIETISWPYQLLSTYRQGLLIVQEKMGQATDGARSAKKHLNC